MFILAFIIKVVISTFVIWLSIEIVDRGNYRNKLRNAFALAFFLSLLGYVPFIWWIGLFAWVFILVNWYSIGFFRSFLCVIVYGVVFFFLNLLLATMLVGGSFVYTKMVYYQKMYARKWEAISEKVSTFFLDRTAPLRDKVGIGRKVDIGGKKVAFRKDIRIFLKNGRVLDARILMEGKKGILIDIADGKSEIVIRKDSIDHIDEI